MSRSRRRASFAAMETFPLARLRSGRPAALAVAKRRKSLAQDSGGLVRNRSRQSAESRYALIREQLLTGAFELLEIARKFCLARAQIIYKQPDQQSHHGINRAIAPASMYSPNFSPMAPMKLMRSASAIDRDRDAKA